MKKELLLCVLSSLLFSLGWIFPAGMFSTVAVFGSFVAFVPLLILQKKNNGKHFLRQSVITFILFNLISISWVGKASVLGVFAATGTYIVLFGVVIFIYNYVWKRAKKPLAYTVLVSCWIAAERLYLNGEISFPWLNLGNSLANNPYIIQWIEYTGTMGLTLWVLIVNLIIFEAVTNIQLRRKFVLAALLFMLIPSIVSVVIFNRYNESQNKIEISIIQPNIDPYNEKFGGLTSEQQEDIIVNLLNACPHTSRYVVAPETALDNSFWINSLSFNPTVERFQSLIKTEKPNTTFITGLTTLRAYPKTKFAEPPTVTARESSSMYYDIYNSAIQIDSTSNIPLYHKSRLVIGVEMLPYHEYIPFINQLSVSLGGISGMLGSQEEASVFVNSADSVKVGTAICYESGYGEYFADFVRKGADVMFVITNDGWWGDTFGYNQHLSFSRLRAIETRRSIARSANTGISAFVSPRGIITEELGWDIRGVLTKEVSLNKEFTFFVVYGDMIGRIATYVFVLSVLYFIAYRRRKKDYLVD